ncbi:MAG TPA: hypothetical protein VGP55_10050 [Chitinophagaceae bacterium]|nr:hypothetical protein [Chitinophagaceae bacterium]
MIADGFEKVLAIFKSANKTHQKVLRSFKLDDYRDIFRTSSTHDLENYMDRAIEKEEYELCGALKKIIEERN